MIPVSVVVVKNIKHAVGPNDHFAGYNFIAGDIFHNFEIQAVKYNSFCFIWIICYI